MPMAYDIGNTTSFKVFCKVGATILVCDLYWTPTCKSILSYMDSFDGNHVIEIIKVFENYVSIIKKWGNLWNDVDFLVCQNKILVTNYKFDS